MSEPVRQLSFSGGEVTPAMFARTDHVKYDTGVRTLRNMVCMRHGGVTGRPGTMYVATTLNSGHAVRLIPFIFNETGTGQSYVLEFGNLYIAFYQNGGVVIATPWNQLTTYGVGNQVSYSGRKYSAIDVNTGNRPDINPGHWTDIGTHEYTIASSYLQADLATLQFAQSADIVTITHQNYAPMELSRIAATNWKLSAITFKSPLAGPTILAETGTVNPTNQTYVVTSVNAQGEETDAGTAILTLTNALLMAPSVTNPITLTIQPLTGAVYYKVYKANDAINPGSQLGYLGQTTGGTFIDNGITPDFAHPPPLAFNGLNTANNYPATVGFIQQRRGFANTINNPLGFWLSQPGDFYNMNVHITNEDSDAIISSLASQEVNAIQHLVELKFMLMLTAGAEVYVQGNGSGVVTPSAINASTQSQYGSSPLRPLKIGDVLLFNQALGSFIRDFSFDFAIDGYRGNDITVFSSHLFEGYSLADWDFQKIPDSILWAARSDGVLLSCTYVREQQILAWAHHDFTNGTVENVCAIPENGNYALYLSIKRTINGSTVRYIERMSSRIWTDPIDATYLDCFSSYDGRNTGSTTLTLTASGSFQTGDTAYQQQLTLSASVPSFFGGSNLGEQFFIQDSEFVSSYGASGNQIRCTVLSLINDQQAIVIPNKAVPAEFQSVATTNWSRGSKTVSGLGYLEGQEVSVWADRFVVGSPLNSNISSVYTVSGGSITLDKSYAVIYVGLPMTQDLQSLDMETTAGPSILAKRKRTGRLNVYTYRSRSLFAGSENPDTNNDNTDDDALYGLVEQMQESSRKTYDEPPNLGTEQDYITFDSRWDYGGRVFIRNVDPIPMSILAIAPEGEDPAPSPFYKKV